MGKKMKKNDSEEMYAYLKHSVISKVFFCLFKTWSKHFM